MSHNYEINRDPSVPLSQRMRELVWADGDRVADWMYNPRAQEFADEVKGLERKLEIARRALADIVERLDDDELISGTFERQVIKHCRDTISKLEIPGDSRPKEVGK